MVVVLKIQVEEAKIMEEVMQLKLKFEMDRCMNLEERNVSLRKDLDKDKEHVEKGLKLKGGSNILDELMNLQKLANKEKSGLGLEKGNIYFVDASTKLYEQFSVGEKSKSINEIDFKGSDLKEKFREFEKNKEEKRPIVDKKD